MDLSFSEFLNEYFVPNVSMNEELVNQFWSEENNGI